MREATKKSYVKVPIIGDVPVLGWAFRKESKGREKLNLLIFVTPTILGDMDFHPTPTEFLKTPPPKPDTSEVGALDSGKPYDWKAGMQPVNKNK
jgi:type II secretory pathway component GspD/PulD (secretin)